MEIKCWSIFYLATILCTVSRGVHSTRVIGPLNKYINIDSDVAFYTWRNTSIEDIHKLLHGEEIILTADFEEGSNIDALKFTKIEIKFILDESSKQHSFDAAINKFSVIMKMIGENQYQCGSQVHSIPKNHDITIIYSLAKRKDGQPKTQNGVYKEIQQNECFVGPFSTWSIQLYTDGSNSPSFDTLAEFADEKMHLQLTGDAEYMHGAPIEFCNEYMSKWTSQHEQSPDMDETTPPPPEQSSI